MTTTTFGVDLKHRTVYSEDRHGERTDLNADGEPCRTVRDLRAFVRDLREQGFYDEATEQRLLGETGQRDAMITIRMSEGEIETLTAAAKRAGLGLGPWLRALGMREAQAAEAPRSPRPRRSAATPP